MLNPNIQYVVRYWFLPDAVTVTNIAYAEEIVDLQKSVDVTAIRVWELETNDLKKVEL